MGQPATPYHRQQENVNAYFHSHSSYWKDIYAGGAVQAEILRARQAAVLAGPAGRVTGVDISLAMLGVARAWHPQDGAAPIEYIESSATDMLVPELTRRGLYLKLRRLGIESRV